MRCLALSLLSVALSAQTLPDGAALMKQSQEAVKRFHSLQFVSSGVMEMGPSTKINTETVTAMVPPGKSRIEVKTMGMTMVTISDGDTTWVYNVTAKQYVKKNAALGTAALMAAIGMSNMPDMTKVKTTEKTVGEETIEVDGQKHDCWIVESRMPEVDLPGPQGAKMTDAVSRLWIDKKLLVDLKSSISMQVQSNQMPQAMEIHMLTVKKDLKIDQPVADSLFQFTPPADAKEVESVMGAALAKVNLAGQAAPDFEMKGIDGKTYSLESLKGKPVLLDFWATWCKPCSASMPLVEKLYATYKDQDLVVLAVNSGEEADAVAAFLKTSPLAYPVVLSGDSGIVAAYQVTAYPTFVMIGREGKIAAHEIGFGGESVLAGMAEKAGLKPHK
jgi:thiol-disulfide isomerase/thioredoxin